MQVTVYSQASLYYRIKLTKKQKCCGFQERVSFLFLLYLNTLCSNQCNTFGHRKLATSKLHLQIKAQSTRGHNIRFSWRNTVLESWSVICVYWPDIIISSLFSIFLYLIIDIVITYKLQNYYKM
jgi:hypothetical protein